jgi:hypothetical protein
MLFVLILLLFVLDICITSREMAYFGGIRAYYQYNSIDETNIIN